jgi:ABC-type amino acid transport substrate-binding protein
VGVHNNQPLAFVDAEGQAKGFLIDIPGSLTECLERLRKGEIDLAVGIEYSRERNEVYDFTYEDVFSDWGAVYTQEGSDINQIVNLDNKKIAVVHDDNHYHNIRNLAQQLKLKCRFVEAYEYDAVLSIDCMVLNFQPTIKLIEVLSSSATRKSTL